MYCSYVEKIFLKYHANGINNAKKRLRSTKMWLWYNVKILCNLMFWVSKLKLHNNMSDVQKCEATCFGDPLLHTIRGYVVKHWKNNPGRNKYVKECPPPPRPVESKTRTLEVNTRNLAVYLTSQLSVPALMRHTLFQNDDDIYSIFLVKLRKIRIFNSSRCLFINLIWWVRLLLWFKIINKQHDSKAYQA
jgi:hypothetical protein